jgi:hypothetical protein
LLLYHDDPTTRSGWKQPLGVIVFWWLLLYHDDPTTRRRDDPKRIEADSPCLRVFVVIKASSAIRSRRFCVTL